MTPQIDLNIEIDLTEVKQLQSLWTYEAEQDIRSQHNVEDAEFAISIALAGAINQEIDEEVIRDIRASLEDPITDRITYRFFVPEWRNQPRYFSQTESKIEKIKWKKEGF